MSTFQVRFRIFLLSLTPLLETVYALILQINIPLVIQYNLIYANNQSTEKSDSTQMFFKCLPYVLYLLQVLHAAAACIYYLFTYLLQVVAAADSMESMRPAPSRHSQ